jgi:hypothetical protein
MAEEETTSTTEETTEEETTTTSTTTTDPDADLKEIAAQGKDPEAVEKALRSERAKAREASKKAEAAATKVKEFEDRDKSEHEKAEQAKTEAEKRATDAEARALRYEVAAAKKLPLKLAARLTGSTKEEMEADADELLELVGGEDQTTDFDGGARKSTKAPADMSAAIRQAAGRS